jgi:DNA-binding NarL/FixJ family response regulator
MHAAADRVTDTLSEREVAVVRLVVEGLTNRAIAGELHVSTSTIQAHVASGMRKLGARSRTQLAVRALRSGIVPLHPDDDRSGA